jgi:hypothetical protein
LARSTDWESRPESGSSQAAPWLLSRARFLPLYTESKRKVGFPLFWEVSENNRRAKYQRLNKAGLKQLEVEAKRWGRISCAIAQAFEAS